MGRSSLRQGDTVLVHAELLAAKVKLADTKLALEEELQARRSLVMDGVKLEEKLGMEEERRKKVEVDNEEAQKRSEELAA